MSFMQRWMSGWVVMMTVVMSFAFAAVAWAEDRDFGGAVLLPTDAREWTSAGGQKFKGRVLAVDHEKKTVTLETEAGKKSEGVPFTNFSAEDQAFFSRCKTQRAGQGKDGKITVVDSEDPEMTKAIAEAVRTFPAAWAVIQADAKRPSPVLDMVMVKASFRDPGAADDDAENMWVMNFSFDEKAKTITGTLGNPPDHLKSVKIGQKVSVPLADLRDWIYFEDEKIKGGFTEKLIHKRMSPAEKKEHNEGTGVNWDEE
ncbi:YegJ family protein [Luteolibacter soli]|uniref:DUF2314 domain-containing protein n=1 Tax=Luteolibacter soli TaxID=3135280 RepID=A0ABU9AUZ7_9BACT